MKHRISYINRLFHWLMHVQTSYVCPMVFDVYNTSRFAYITITIRREVSANLCCFQQCHSDVNDLAGSVPQHGSGSHGSMSVPGDSNHGPPNSMVVGS